MYGYIPKTLQTCIFPMQTHVLYRRKNERQSVVALDLSCAGAL